MVRRNFFVPIPKISSIEDLNAQLLEYCHKYRSHKISGKSMTVGEMSENCGGHWIPLPPYRFDTSNTIQVKADDFSLVKFDHNKYSVPYRYSSKTITVKGSGNKVRMICGGEIIAEYERDYRHDQTHYCLEHYIGLIEKRPRSVYNAAPIKGTVPKEFYQFLMKQENPKDIVKSLRLYLDIGDELLSHLPYVDSYDALHACVMKQITAPISHSAEVKIIMPDLKRYDLLLKGGDSV